MSGLQRQHAAAAPRRGFTLIELAVVIAIIGLLVAILLPALAQARSSARIVLCAANLQQAGIAVHAYADDYQGYMVPSAEMVSSLSVTIHNSAFSFDDLLDPYMSRRLSPSQAIASHVEKEMQADNWACPADSLEAEFAAKRSYATTGPQLGDTGYARVESGSNLRHRLLRLGTNAVPDESGTFMITEFVVRDRAGFAVNLMGATNYSQVDAYYHQDPRSDRAFPDERFAVRTHGSDESPLFNYLYIDGHVALMDPEQTINPDAYDRWFSGGWTLDPYDRPPMRKPEPEEDPRR